MADCPKCASSLFVSRCLWCHYDASPLIAEATKPCPQKCAATIFVQRSLDAAGAGDVPIRFDGGDAVNADPQGFRSIPDLDPGPHAASIDLTGLEDKYAFPIGKDGGPVSKTIPVAQNEFYVFTVDPLTKLKVVVKRRHDSNGVPGTKVTIEAGQAGNNPAVKEQTTPAGGDVTFTRLRQDSYQLKAELDDTARKKYELVKADEHHVLDMAGNPDEVVLWARLVIHLKLKYKDPEDTVRCFPRDFPVQVVFSDNTTQDLKILDDEGYFKFPVDDDKKTGFTLKFNPGAVVRYLVHEDGKETPELVSDPDETALQTMSKAGKKFFLLPNAWSLAHSTWVDGLAVPQDGKILIPSDGLGTSDAPSVLTLQPLLQYVRLQFHDRKYGRVDHARKQVHVPALTLRAARTCDDTTGAPVATTAGPYDACSNWMLDKADNAKGCQVLPWIITKDDTGTDLPKLNNKMLLEFGVTNGFVVSNGAADRVIEIIPTGDARRQPNKDRHKYYDLPALWRSKCYYTRLPGGDADPSKNRFFDELTETEVEISLTRTTPFVFSLDDIVLVGSSGTQELKDWDKSAPSAALDLSRHSRVALLHLDADDLHKVKVFDPFPKAPYFSKTLFTEDKAHKFRNLLTAYPCNTRAVVFCNGFHDVYDKRSTATDFSRYEVQGARAAHIDDAHVSLTRPLSNSARTDGYAFRKGVSVYHYLHYGESNGKTVYSALVTHWSAFVFSETATKPASYNDPDNDPFTGNPIDARNFREIALGKAMERWNEKDYQFEEADDAADHVVKSFCLFEAKEVEEPDGTFNRGGGPGHVQMAIGTKGSWDMVKIMYMRKAAYEEEPTRFPDQTDIHGRTYKVLVMAHELGHAAIGLYDDYITKKWKDRVPCYFTTKATPQDYLGVAYNRDDASMMKENHAPRLRMYWGRAKWLGDHAAAGQPLNQFLGAKTFKATWSLGAPRKFNYRLKAAPRTIFDPAHQQANHPLGEQGMADLYLYELGDDEMAAMIPGGPYNGMLVVEMRLCVGFAKGLDTVQPDWDEARNYAVGNVVGHDGKFFACIDAHLSSEANAPSGGKWAELDPAADDYAWTLGTDCDAKEWYTDSGNTYVATKNHKSGSLIAEYFKNSAGGAFERLSMLTATDRGAFASGTDFAVGDYCTDGGITKICQVAHKAGSIEADIAAKRLVKVTCSPKDWSDQEKADWIEEANKSIVNMLELPDGKFKFTLANSTDDFSRIYLRAFPQWSVKADPSDPDPAETQFSLTVYKGGGEKFFHPTGRVVVAGIETSTKTLNRFYFGRISDVKATRKGQDKTSDLAKTDLVKLKEWLDSTLTKKFTIGPIP
jgi:hypothetical protein